jgi:hypothetical protein
LMALSGLDLVVVVRFNRCNRILGTALRASKVLLVDYTLHNTSQYYSPALWSVFAYNEASSSSPSTTSTNDNFHYTNNQQLMSLGLNDFDYTLNNDQ